MTPRARIHALLVAIDAYVPPINPLYGCRNDMAALRTYLEARAGAELRLRVLEDDAATRDSLVAAFRDHLGRPGRATSRCSPSSATAARSRHRRRSPRSSRPGACRRILLHDCGRRIDGKLRRALADKELSLLIAEVAATGAHVVTILDCCHAGGGTRDPFARPRSWRPLLSDVAVADRDVVVELASARPATEFLPGALDQWSSPRPVHVALAACRSDELAKEHRVGDATRGAFSVALVESLDVLGTRTTYRSLLATVRARVERTTEDQRPELFPLDVGGPGDTLFLDGAVVPVAADVHRRPADRTGGRSTAGSSTASATRSATRRSCWRATTTPAPCSAPCG